jgi:hypothetical protein
MVTFWCPQTAVSCESGAHFTNQFLYRILGVPKAAWAHQVVTITSGFINIVAAGASYGKLQHTGDELLPTLPYMCAGPPLRLPPTPQPKELNLKLDITETGLESDRLPPSCGRPSGA